MTKEYARDYSLLRPFDLESAKRGEEICYNGHGCDKLQFVTHLNGRDIVVEHENAVRSIMPVGVVRMKPLCWVEGKPCYKEDVLYSTLPDGSVFVAENTKEMSDGTILFDKTQGIHIKYLTWQKPKQKREGWINIYPNGYTSDIHATEQKADDVQQEHRKACIRIEWEE